MDVGIRPSCQHKLAPMYFKLDYTVKAIQLGERDCLRLELQRPKGCVTIALRKLEEAELTNGSRKGDLLCVAMTERHTFVREEVLFDAMDKKVPDGIMVLLDEVRNELDGCIRSTLHNIRWNRGLTSPHNPIRFGSALRWSRDGTTWKVAPGEIRFDLSAECAQPLWMKDDEIDRIKQYVEQGLNEPLGHHLLLEAWSQMSDNPRSALVMAIAAAETGWKEFVAHNLPQTQWLLENLPSPPLEKMLRELMPTIKTKAHFIGKKTGFPPTLLNVLKKGVHYRNRTVHGSSTSLSRAELDEVLKAVRDLLYMLDAYNGMLWAGAHIRRETISALVPVSETPDSRTPVSDPSQVSIR